MRPLLILLGLLFVTQGFARSLKLTQKRYQLTYEEAGATQLLRFKGTLIVERGESAENLLRFLRQEVRQGMEIKLVLDMFGGDLAIVNKVYDLLKSKQAPITTQVEMFRYCASACVPLFMVGDERIAAERSSWGFHQASTPVVPVMIPFMAEYVLRDKGVNKAWLTKNKGMFRTLKMTWLSPHDLNGSGILTKIILHPK